MEDLSNLDINHQIALQRAVNSRINDEVRPVFLSLRDELNAYFSTFEFITTKQQLAERERQVREIIEPRYAELLLLNMGLIGWLSEYELDFQLNLLAEHFETEVSEIDSNLVVKDTLNQPPQVGDNSASISIEQMQDRFTTYSVAGVLGALATSYYQQVSANNTRLAIVGTTTNNYNDGLLAKQKRDFETIMRTTAAHTESKAKARAFRSARVKKPDGKTQKGTDGYVLSAVLDSRTSAFCRNIHGTVVLWSDKSQPMPPFHYNCRTKMVPYIDGEFVSESGQNYYDWLKRQPADVQDEVLGKTKGKIFRNSGVTTAEFKKLIVNRLGEPLTIDELAEKDKRINDYLTTLKG